MSVVVEKDHILGNGDVYIFPDADGFRILSSTSGSGGDFNVMKGDTVIYIFKEHRWDNGGFGDGTQNRHSLRA